MRRRKVSRKFGSLVRCRKLRNRKGSPGRASRPEFWNRLLESSNISLFCGYPIDIFAEEFRGETIDPVLCTHTHMVPVDGTLETALHRPGSAKEIIQLAGQYYQQPLISSA